MKKLTKFIYPIYIVLLLFTFFFIKRTLSIDEIKFQQMPENDDEEVVETKLVDVSLQVKNGRGSRIYEEELRNVDSVLDFLEKLRDSYGLYYEVVEHSYGTEFEDVNYIKAPEGYKWELYKESDKITNNAAYTKLNDNDIFIFLLEKKEVSTK